MPESTILRRVAMLHGSDSDLPQMAKGLALLQENHGVTVHVMGVFRYSIHHNPLETMGLLAKLKNRDVQFIIAGAGWANHLSGMTDRLLRNMLHDDSIHVLPIAFEDPKDADHTETAIRSIKHVPRHDMGNEEFVGETGFAEAARKVIYGEDSDFKPIALGRKDTEDRTVGTALAEAQQMKANLEN